jgi:hypothetical protein
VYIKYKSLILAGNLLWILKNNMSQNANDRGWFVKIKTRLITKRKRECKKRGDYIYIAKG